MKACARQSEVMHAVRAGQWPLGCAVELREHVASCEECANEARMMTAFAIAREGSMRLAPAQSAGLLWWKAQLRRRREAMERLDRPAFTLRTVTVAASVILLIAVLGTAWKSVEWSRLAAIFSLRGWSPWIAGSMASLLCAFAVAAVVVGLGLADERK